MRIMRQLRRHLAVLALATTAVLFAGVGGVSAAAGLAMRSIGASTAGDDCCPPGSHPGQMCPMHRHGGAGATASRSGADARFCTCRDLNPAGLLVAGITLDRIVVSVPTSPASAPADQSVPVIDASPVPASPPPRA
jgi:hypothetical protein